MVLLAFCLAAATQQLFSATLQDDGLQVAFRPDLCGMHGLAELRARTYPRTYRGSRDPNHDRLMGVCLFKVVMENIPQLLLQTSFFSLTFDELTPLGRAKVLFSILLGLASASLKILDLIRDVVKSVCEYGIISSMPWGIIYSVPFVLAALLFLWTMAKLFFVFHCETHLWNLGSGCVEWT